MIRPALLTLSFTAALAGQALADPASRVVSLGGAVTEIVFALGEEDRLVARDTTSDHPAAAEELPDVGYIRALSAEGVLSVSPDLILAEEGAGPPEAVELLKRAHARRIRQAQPRSRTNARPSSQTAHQS